MFFVLVFLVVVAAAIGLTIRIVPEHERAVVFRLGRSRGERGPGPVFVVSGLDDLRRVTTKVLVLDIPVGEVVTTDDVTMRVRVTVYARVTDPEKAVLEVENYRVATTRVAHDVIRARLGTLPSPQLLHEQLMVNSVLTTDVNHRATEWGVSIERAEIADLEIVGAEKPSAGSGRRMDEPAEFGDF